MDVDKTAAHLREAGAGITQGLLVVDGDLRIVFVNRPYRTFFGLDEADPLAQPGVPLAELLRHHGMLGEYGPGDVDAHVAARMDPVRARQSWSMDRQQPSGRYLNITGNPLPSGGFVFTFTDVTDRVRERERLDALVAERTRELEEVNNKLLEGIEYARMLQGSTLPPKGLLRETFGDHYLIFQPLDIVGGDFYFCVAKEYGVYFGVADCTGHGVPGALMTMLARTVMRQAVDEVGPDGPAAVLDLSDRLTRASLGQGGAGEGLDNGFDVVLCLMDDSHLRIGGAGIGLVWQGKDGLQEIAGRRGGLGYARRRQQDRPIEEVRLPVGDVQRLFLTTDGLYDLPGGEKGFGFGRRRWFDALRAGAESDFRSQCAGVVAALEAYSGDLSQRDDVTFLALDLAAGRGGEGHAAGHDS
ncbi:PAS-domain containing protein [Marinibaculum pumilum]|uniref:PAS-domain containing protein n=1 Tax=Marinibaculum pumilum TaxID=1766165 RepID=A0ABV7KTQ1_9PROT